MKNLYRGSFYPESYTPILISFSAANADYLHFLYFFQGAIQVFFFPWRFLKVCLILVVNSEIQEKSEKC